MFVCAVFDGRVTGGSGDTENSIATVRVATARSPLICASRIRPFPQYLGVYLSRVACLFPNLDGKYIRLDSKPMTHHFDGRGPLADLKTRHQLQTDLAAAGDLIATLESKLAITQKALDQLLADDLRTCEVIADLQKIIWNYHLGLGERCNCTVCVEVERGRMELQ